MKIRFIGTGGAFDIAYGNSAAIVECNGKQILVDCGHTVFPKLLEKNLIEPLDYLLVTHLHDDHVGSLSTLIFYLHFYLPHKKVCLIAPNEFQQELIAFLNFSQKNVHQFIEIRALPDFITPIDTRDLHYPGMQTYAYIFSEEKEHMVYSGDLNSPQFLRDAVESRALKGKVQVFHDVTFNPAAKKAHAYYQDIERCFEGYTLWGYHCNPTLKPKDCKLPLVIENSDLLC